MQQKILIITPNFNQCSKLKDLIKLSQRLPSDFKKLSKVEILEFSFLSLNEKQRKKNIIYTSKVQKDASIKIPQADSKRMFTNKLLAIDFTNRYDCKQTPRALGFLFWKRKMERSNKVERVKARINLSSYQRMVYSGIIISYVFHHTGVLGEEQIFKTIEHIEFSFLRQVKIATMAVASIDSICNIKMNILENLNIGNAMQISRSESNYIYQVFKEVLLAGVESMFPCLDYNPISSQNCLTQMHQKKLLAFSTSIGKFEDVRWISKLQSTQLKLLKFDDLQRDQKCIFQFSWEQKINKKHEQVKIKWNVKKDDEYEYSQQSDESESYLSSSDQSQEQSGQSEIQLQEEKLSQNDE